MWAYFRPAALIELEAGLDADNSISAWDFTNYNSGSAAIDTPYRIPNTQARFIASDSPLRTGSYRVLAATANNFAREAFTDELAQAAGVAVVLDEGSLPLRAEVVGTCEILGIDPLYVACEGRVVAVVAPEACDQALATLRRHPLGADAAIVGEIRPDPEGFVLLDTTFGGNRIVDMLVGDPLPRIC